MFDKNKGDSIKYLDGLRGYAVLLVIVSHGLFIFDMRGIPIPSGIFGVNMFFVLTGFLITLSLFKEIEKKGEIDLKNFYINRALRILPTLLISLLIFIPIIAANGYDRIFLEISNSLFFISNWTQTFRIYEPHYFPHTWYLATVVQFYLFWPFLFMIRRRVFFSNKSFYLIFLIPYLLYPLINSIFKKIGLDIYPFFLLRIPEFYIGGLAGGIFFHRDTLLKDSILTNLSFVSLIKKVCVVIMFLMIWSIRGTDPPSLIYGGLCIFVILSTVLIFCLSISEDKFSNILFENRPMKQLGVISYGVYLYHLPLYFLVFEFSEQKIFPLIENQFELVVAKLVIFSAATFVAILISLLSYEYFEKPFLRLKKFL